MVDDNQIKIFGEGKKTNRERRFLSYRKDPQNYKHTHIIERSSQTQRFLKVTNILSEVVLMVEPACKGWNETLGEGYNWKSYPNLSDATEKVSLLSLEGSVPLFGIAIAANPRRLSKAPRGSPAPCCDCIIVSFHL